MLVEVLWWCSSKSGLGRSQCVAAPGESASILLEAVPEMPDCTVLTEQSLVFSKTVTYSTDSVSHSALDDDASLTPQRACMGKNALRTHKVWPGKLESSLANPRQTEVTKTA